MRKPLVAGNWKMHCGPEKGVSLVRELRRRLVGLDGVEVVVCPPFISLPAVASSLPQRGPIAVGAQNCHWERQGAFTGEVSPWMLRDLCGWVILGHSERRTHSCESEELLNRRVRAAVAAGLHVIFCVGEPLAVRERGETAGFVRQQVRVGLNGLAPNEVERRLVVAYEPIWASGSGRPATGAVANWVAGLVIRAALAESYGTAVAERVRVLYGGSVTQTNAAEFFVQPEIDGALVGGASLQAEQFAGIVSAAEKSSRQRSF
ncbi:MAG TPA: triose-phosphate isomerase [Ardenticatenaceae bacterium]|nr:triose-phosphate isomerase [Ardenticatenaceae bacterium]